MADKSDLAFLKSNRSRLRAKSTRVLNNISSSDVFGSRDIKRYLDELKDIKTKLEKSNEEVVKLMWNLGEKEGLDAEYEKCEEYEQSIADAIADLGEQLQAESGPQTTVCTGAGASSLRQGQLKLPQLPLPEYSHAPGESLENFITNFENVLQNYNLTTYEKYIYLERQLSGEPLLLIRSLYGTDQSYDEAKKLLVKAFASPVIQKFDVLQKLSNLNLNYNGSPYVFVSEMRSIVHSIKSLNVTIDDILQFFVWKAMPFTLQTQLINITNNNKPTVIEIEEHIFSAIDRFQSVKNRKNDSKPLKPQESASNFAANVHIKESAAKFKPCLLCSEDSAVADHAISRCTKYLSAESKLAQLKKLKACIKCANNNHKSENCQFRFYKSCYNCKGMHFSFLCPNNQSQRSSSSNNSNVRVSTGTISIEARTVNFESNFPTLLPTFTVSITDGYRLHGIKDSGAQCTIILSSVALEKNLKVLDHVQIEINGFNSSKPYDTTVVEVPIAIGGTTHKISAVCVPDINIRLKIKGLNKLVSKCVTHKINLADKNLLDLNENEVISNIDLILGADCGYLLSEGNSVVGPNSRCNCYDTSLGVILMGKIENIFADILPPIETVENLSPSNFTEIENIKIHGTHPSTGIPSVPVKNACKFSTSVVQVPLQKSNGDGKLYGLGDGIDLSSDNLSATAKLNKNGMLDKISIQSISGITVVDENGLINDEILETALNEHIANASDDILNDKCFRILNRKNESDQ